MATTTTYGDTKRRVLSRMGPMAAQVTPEDLLQAINDSIEDGREGMPYDTAPDVTNVTLAEDTCEYSHSSNTHDIINTLTMADEDGDYPDWNIIPQWHWDILQGTTPYIKFDERMWSPTAGRKIRIEGKAFQATISTVSSDSTVIYISASFIVAKAAAFLLGALGSEREELMERRAEGARARASYQWNASSRRVYR